MVPFAIIAASCLHFLDPWCEVYQTDDDREGRAMKASPDYWPMPCGQVDPLEKEPRARVIHTLYRDAESPASATGDEVSDLIKVNQVGYLPDAPKYAYLGLWLGPKRGAWKPHVPLTSWQLVDAATMQVAKDSPYPPMQRVNDACNKEGTPFTGEETYDMDFSDIRTEGEYFIRVPGVGRSANFRISSSAAAEAWRMHMYGLYHKRCGIAKEEPYTHWTSGECHTEVLRGTFPPDEGELTPKVRWFEVIASDIEEIKAHCEKLQLNGGWHDAADYDRRPQHFNIVGDLCAVYLLNPGNFADGELLIPENSNGLPDILDEAEWGLKHLLAAQQENGGVGTWVETVRHPVPGNVAAEDPDVYALSRATRRSSLMYAAHAALISRTDPSFREKYLESAVNAWNYAFEAKPENAVYELKRRRYKIFTERQIVYWDEPEELLPSYMVKGALNLYLLTGDDKYLMQLEHNKKFIMEESQKTFWDWPPLMFVSEEVAMRSEGGGDFKKFPPVVGEFFKLMDRRIFNTSAEILKEIDSAYAYRVPWYAPGSGKVHTMSWGNSHPLRRAQFLVAAHALSGNPKYLAYASLANDFHNGCNPQGTTLTSALGRVYPVAFLDLPSYVDGIAEYVPGITPYRWTYGLNWRFVDMVFGGDKPRAAKWPIWRRWCNVENRTVAESEYTVWETIAPAASVTAYLKSGPATGAPRKPKPAAKLSDLPGYWLLP